MKVQALKCPECNASLSIDREIKHCFCQYCGTKIILDDGSTAHTYRKVDEARIKEAEVLAQIRLKELEMEEKKRAIEENAKVTKIKLSIILGIVGILLTVIGFIAGDASGDSDSPLYVIGIMGVFVLGSIFFIWLNGIKSEE